MTRPPRVLGGNLGPGPDAGMRRAPRAIGNPEGTAPDVAAAAPRPRPRPIPGRIRRAVGVEPDALAQRFPTADAPTLAAAVAALGTVVVESFDWIQAQRFGMELQKQYAALVQRQLEIASADVLRAAPQHLSRLLGRLEACAAELEPATDLVPQWLRRKRPGALEEHRGEIDRLATRLSASLSDLEWPIAQTIDVRDRLGALAVALVGAGLASEWLAEAPGLACGDEVREALAERALSLAKTAALARQQQLHALATANDLDALRDRVHEGVLIALPSWLAQLAGRTAAFSETDRFIARDGLDKLIERLRR